MNVVRRLLRYGGRRHAALTAPVLVVEEVQLLTSSRLPRQPKVDAVFGRVVDRACGLIRLVGPLRDVPGVLVPKEPAHVVRLPREPGRSVEPEPIVLERPAKPRIDVSLML